MFGRSRGCRWPYKASCSLCFSRPLREHITRHLRRRLLLKTFEKKWVLWIMASSCSYSGESVSQLAAVPNRGCRRVEALGTAFTCGRSCRSQYFVEDIKWYGAQQSLFLNICAKSTGIVLVHHFLWCGRVAVFELKFLHCKLAMRLMAKYLLEIAVLLRRKYSREERSVVSNVRYERGRWLIWPLKVTKALAYYTLNYLIDCYI